jgi:hypothetical protein
MKTQHDLSTPTFICSLVSHHMTRPEFQTISPAQNRERRGGGQSDSQQHLPPILVSGEHSSGTADLAEGWMALVPPLLAALAAAGNPVAREAGQDQADAVSKRRRKPPPHRRAAPSTELHLPLVSTKIHLHVVPALPELRPLWPRPRTATQGARGHRGS